MLSIGLANGAIANYQFEIESETFFDPSDAAPSDSPRGPTKRCKYSGKIMEPF